MQINYPLILQRSVPRFWIPSTIFESMRLKHCIAKFYGVTSTISFRYVSNSNMERIHSSKKFSSSFHLNWEHDYKIIRISTSLFRMKSMSLSQPFIFFNDLSFFSSFFHYICLFKFQDGWKQLSKKWFHSSSYISSTSSIFPFFFVGSTYSSNCNLNISSDSGKNGTFQSPNYPNPYPPSTTCIYEFNASGKERVQIIFLDFDLKLPADDHSPRE